MARKPVTPVMVIDKTMLRYDILLEGWAENLSPYSTTLPSQQTRRMSAALPLPQMNGRPYIRAQQDKQRHRHQAVRIASGDAYLWETVHAALQAYQGSFMQTATSTKLDDRDKVQAKNPPVVLHGTATIGGQMQFGHLFPRNDVETREIPVVRTDSTEQQIYTISTEGSAAFTDFRRLHDSRKVYTTARVQLDRKKPATEVLTALKKALEDTDRQSEGAEVGVLLAKDPTIREVANWLKVKHETYKRDMDRAGVPNVEIRQALPGYEVIVPHTIFDQKIQAIGLFDYHAGLMFLSFYQRNPTLGGHTANGCGAHLRRVFRVFISDNPAVAPRFDCLMKIEPFKAIEFCRENIDPATITSWIGFKDLKWESLPLPGEPVPDDACFAAKAVVAWYDCDKTQFDLDYVPRSSSAQEDDEAGGEVE